MAHDALLDGGSSPLPRPTVARDPQLGVRRVGPCVALAVAVVVALAGPSPVAAQPDKSKPPAGGEVESGKPNKGKPKVFDFGTLDVSGRLRTPQLLYFLDRANEELERASLERRSFIPEMVRSIDENGL